MILKSFVMSGITQAMLLTLPPENLFQLILYSLGLDKGILPPGARKI